VVFSPFFLIYFVLLLAALFFFFGLIQIGLIAYGLQHAGLTPQQAFGMLLLSLVGSFINIPVWRFEQQDFEVLDTVYYFGIRYRVPPFRRKTATVIAVNVGGAVLPTLLSLYLLLREPAAVMPGVLAIAAVSFITHRFARPLKGVGIAMPMFVAPLAAVVAAYVFHWLLGGGCDVSAIAYVGGAMGTLVGADLLNLGKVKQLGAPVASIGGAGTFDGIFLAGLIAALLA
jgi:uncharacterized membrane protein